MNMNNMAMVNMNNLLNIKDSRWLQLEVCREFQRNKCTRPDTECKFAHPPANVEVQNGRVTACYDSIKGRCNREKPPCKYFHPPLHLKDQLLINGRNHLALKNALMQQMGLAPGQPVVPGQVPQQSANPYQLAGQAYNPYFATGPLVPLVTSDPSGGSVVSPLGVPQQNVVQQKVSRGDRLDVSQNHWTTNNNGGYYCINAESYPGMVAYKRPSDKSGVPVYQPANNPSAYQQLMQLQQPFVPVSSATVSQASAASTGTTNSSSTQDQQTNGTLDSNALGDTKRKPDSSEENNDVDGNNLGGVNSNDVDEEGKGESSVKRMRTNNTGNGLNAGGAVSNAAVIAQNNSAYAAAAQSYHNALAAINYTGVALQTNKNPQPQPNPANYQGVNALQSAGGMPQQQQQFLAQYQAMLAALASNPAALQGNLQASVNQQQQNLNMQNVQAQMNPAFAALGAMNPLFAASFPQLAAAQRASLMQGQQQNAQLSQFAGLQGAQNLQFNPLMQMQYANQPNPLQQNQQALLAAYGQIARGPVPVSGAQTMATQQLFVGNPAAAAAAAAAVAQSNGAMQSGVKRMRPA